MLTLRTDQRNGNTSIEEIEHAAIDHNTGCLSYLPTGSKRLRRLTPTEVSQAFVMNDAGRTVLSHNFVESAPKKD